MKKMENSFVVSGFVGKDASIHQFSTASVARFSMAQKIITFANHKGGVSKTTSTASIGACMAMKGKKVLLIDLDGQANLTLYFIPNEDEIETSIFDSLVNGVPLPVKHIRENLDLVPSSLKWQVRK